jgi:hypothetical protein
MNSIYNKNNAPIPIYIQITGANTDLQIELLNESSDHNLTGIAYIILKPEDTDKFSFNKSLSGNSLQNGKYNVFINTSELSKGYYKLKVNIPKYNKTDAMMFFLIDNN